MPSTTTFTGTGPADGGEVGDDDDDDDEDDDDKDDDDDDDDDDEDDDEDDGEDDNNDGETCPVPACPAPSVTADRLLRSGRFRGLPVDLGWGDRGVVGSEDRPTADAAMPVAVRAAMAARDVNEPTEPTDPSCLGVPRAGGDCSSSLSGSVGSMSGSVAWRMRSSSALRSDGPTRRATK